MRSAVSHLSASVWDIDGLFNNRLLQIEQLVEKECFARLRESRTVCVLEGNDEEEKKEQKKNEGKKK